MMEMIWMTKSLDTFIIKKKIELAETVNLFIFLVRKLPFLGKFLGDKYKFKTLKAIINRFYPIFIFVKQLLWSILSFFIAILVVNNILTRLYNFIGGEFFYINVLNKNQVFDLAYRNFLPVYFYICGGVFRNLITDNMADVNKYLNSFHFNPKNICLGNLYYQPMLRLLTRSLVFMVAFYFLAKINPILSLALSIGIYFIEIAASVFWMNFEIKHEKSFLSNGFFHFFIMLILWILLAFLGLFTNFKAKIFVGLILILAALAFIFAKAYMRNFDSYGIIIEKSLREYEETMEEIDTNVNNKFKLKAKDLKDSKVKGTGFAYLNNLFFKRHKRIILKPTLIKSAILLGGGLVVFSMVFRDSLSYNELGEVTIRLTPLIMYTLCRQDNIIGAFFINCDQGLMPYGFYRQGKNLLTMYWQRLISMLKLNMLPALATSLIYMIFVCYKKELTNPTNLLIIVYIFLVASFFTSLSLVKYYLLQPYNQEGKPSGFFVGIINLLIYIVCIRFLSFTENMNKTMILTIVLVFIIVFTIVSNLSLIHI